MSRTLTAGKAERLLRQGTLRRVKAGEASESVGEYGRHLTASLCSMLSEPFALCALWATLSGGIKGVPSQFAYQNCFAENLTVNLPNLFQPFFGPLCGELFGELLGALHFRPRKVLIPVIYDRPLCSSSVASSSKSSANRQSL